MALAQQATVSVPTLLTTPPFSATASAPTKTTSMTSISRATAASAIILVVIPSSRSSWATHAPQSSAPFTTTASSDTPLFAAALSVACTTLDRPCTNTREPSLKKLEACPAMSSRAFVACAAKARPLRRISSRHSEKSPNSKNVLVTCLRNNSQPLDTPNSVLPPRHAGRCSQNSTNAFLPSHSSSCSPCIVCAPLLSITPSKASMAATGAARVPSAKLRWKQASTSPDAHAGGAISVRACAALCCACCPLRA
mmetsp:Transcript_17941/g.55660  ORF Transcript_17941/g.55660 Transcript_17941/m.55660 type:complete len:253 (+) Transcript_17941:214-972(+)